jgi:hypothetical protein
VSAYTISTVLNSNLSPATSGEYGNASFTSGALINSGGQRVFNESKYFARNGSGVKTCAWYAGSVRLISETPLQMYNSVLKGFNMKNDLLGGTSPYIRHYSDFIETNFGHLISFQATGESDMYTISGLDSSQQPLSIAWEVVGGDPVSDSHHRQTLCLPPAVPSLRLSRSLACRMAPRSNHRHALCPRSVLAALSRVVLRLAATTDMPYVSHLQCPRSV